MRKRRIAWTLVATLISEAVNKIVPLLTLHLASTRLGVEGFGVSQFALWILETGILLVAFGYPQSLPVMLRQAASISEKQELVAAVTANRILQAVVITGAIAVLIVALPGWQAYAPAVFASGFILFTSALELGGVMLALQKSAFVSIPMIAGKLASLAGIWWFVRTSADTVSYVVITSAANAIVGICTFLIGWKLLGMRMPSGRSMTQAFRAATPFACAIILLAALERFDLAIVERYLGTTGAGWYSGPARLLLSVTPVAFTISSVFYSEMLAVHDAGEIRRHFRVAVLATMAILLPVTSGTWIAGAGALELVFGPAFTAQAGVLSVVISAAAAHGIIVICGFQMLALHQKTRLLLAALAIGLAAGLLTGIPATAMWGLEGAAWATVVARWVAALLVVRAVLRSTSIQFSDLMAPVMKAGIPAGVMAAMLYAWISARQWTISGNLDQLGPVVIAGVIIYVVIFGLVNRREAAMVWRRLQRRS